MQTLSVTIQMRATEQYFPVVLFIRLCKEVVAFVSLDANFKCDHSNGSLTAQYFGGVYCLFGYTR